MRNLMVLLALIACSSEKKTDTAIAGSASATSPTPAAPAEPPRDSQLELRRAYAAKAEDVWRRKANSVGGSATTVRLRGVREDVLVFSHQVIEGTDMCSDELLAAYRDPTDIPARNYTAAGIIRVECETLDGRVFGVDLK